MKKNFLTALGIACLFTGTITFANKPHASSYNLKQSYADTTPNKMHMKSKMKNKSGDSSKTSGMYGNDNTQDTSTSSTSTGDYNNSSKSGDSTSNKPPKL